MTLSSKIKSIFTNIRIGLELRQVTSGKISATDYARKVTGGGPMDGKNVLVIDPPNYMDSRFKVDQKDLVLELAGTPPNWSFPDRPIIPRKPLVFDDLHLCEPIDPLPELRITFPEPPATDKSLDLSRVIWPKVKADPDDKMHALRHLRNRASEAISEWYIQPEVDADDWYKLPPLLGLDEHIGQGKLVDSLEPWQCRVIIRAWKRVKAGKAKAKKAGKKN